MARLLKDWTASESVEQLTESAEVFFTRLIMKADDYGNYVGNVKLIKAALFPLKDSITVVHIERCILECEKAGLLEKYTVEGKDYLHIPGFDQKLRRMKAIYPEPPARTNGGKLRTDGGQARTSADKCPPELEEKKEVETEVELEHEARAAFDEIYLEGLKMSRAYPGIDIDTQLAQFLQKVRGSPRDYMSHDTSGFRKAFNFQLRNARPVMAQKPKADLKL